MCCISMSLKDWNLIFLSTFNINVYKKVASISWTNGNQTAILSSGSLDTSSTSTLKGFVALRAFVLVPICTHQKVVAPRAAMK